MAESDFDPLPNNYKSCSAEKGAGPRGSACGLDSSFPAVRPSPELLQDAEREQGETGWGEGRGEERGEGRDENTLKTTNRRCPMAAKSEKPKMGQL